MAKATKGVLPNLYGNVIGHSSTVLEKKQLLTYSVYKQIMEKKISPKLTR